MDVIKYGFRYWKKYFPVAVIIHFCLPCFWKIWQSSDLPAVFPHCRCIWHLCDSPDYINLHKKYNFAKTWTEYGNRFKSGYIS